MNRNYLLLQLLTLSRVFIAALVSLLFLLAPVNAWTIFVAAALGGLVELTDLYDGKLARKYELTSDFGKFFDPYTDSIARLILFFSLTSAGLAPLWLPVGMALRDVSVSYIRLFSLQAGIVMASRMSGKVKAWAQGIGYFLLLVLAFCSRFDLSIPQAKSYLALIVLAFTLWSLVDYSLSLFWTLKKRKD